MNIGHSRLLKFVLQSKPIMTEPETKPRFFYKEPENVESIVPGEQKLRESVETSELAVADPTQGEGDKSHNPGNYVLTPVVTVTKNEEIKNGVFVTMNSSAYPEIQSDVPHQTQAIRKMGDHKDSDTKKTRIPKLRFRQAVNRVRKEMRSSDGEKVPPPYQRRSSIPRLKRVVSIEKDKPDNKEPLPVEDEFDKIYDEAVTVPVSLDENILNTVIDDPVKVENSFEEIIHAYDESNTPSKDVDKPKHSKIPMLKRKSQHEIELPKNFAKINNEVPAERPKVRDVINRYSEIHNNETKPNSRTPKRTHIPKISRGSNSVENKNNYMVEEISSPIIYNVKEVEVSNLPIQQSNVITNTNTDNGKVNAYNRLDILEEKAPIYNEIVELLPLREISEVEIKCEPENTPITPVKVVSVEELNLVTENLMKNTEYSMEYNMKDEFITKQINTPTERNTDDNSVNTFDEVKEAVNVEKINLDYDKLHNDDLDDDILIKGKVSKMIRQLSSNLEHKDAKPILDEDVPKPKSVLSKIAMFERSTPSSTIPKTLNENKTSISPVVRSDEENLHKPHIVDGKLKTTDENYNSKSNTVIYEENNNIVHNIISEEFNVSPLTVVDKILETEDVIFENQPSQNDFFVKEATIQNEQYFPSNIVEDTKDEIELEAAETYTIEYAQPVNCIESIPNENSPKFNQIRILNNNEDVVYVNFKNNEFENSEPRKYNNRLYKSHNKLDSNNTEPQMLDNKFDDKNIGNESTNYDFKRLRTTSEDTRKQKVKSLADLELGDAVKGKVHQLIYRMNSNEMLNVEKKEVINAKERPRKKSVSEKIALFEGKLAVAKIPSETTSTPPKRSYKPLQPAPVGLSDDEVEAKIAELKGAKIKYGYTEVTKKIVLANSEEMPAIAVGTALLDPKLAVHIVSAAIDLGYRAIDTAYICGNEKEVGEAIRKKIEDGTVKREDLFIISKLWSTYHRTDLVEVACRKSLETLGLDYFDLYLIHNPMSFKEGPEPIPRIANVLQYSEYDYLDAWFGMEQLVTKQLVKSIGVSNFNAAQLQRLLDKARIKPVINQVECHPYLTQYKLDQFCSEHNIKLSCFGILGSKGTPLENKGSNNPVLEDALVQVMAAGLSITPAQLLISYQVELGHGVVVKASSAAHLYENLRSLENSLSDGQLDAISALNKNRRTFTFKGMGDTHKNYPFKTQF